MSSVSFKEKVAGFFRYIKENKAELKKKIFGTEGLVFGTVIFAFLFLTVIIVQSCTPRKGNILYGMCHEFLQTQVLFPHTIQLKEIEMYSKGVRIHFSHLDGFGEYQLEMTECQFYQDPQKGVQLDKAYFNYVKPITQKERSPGKGRLYEVEQKYVDLFNRSMSPAAILTNEPDLVIPKGVRVYYY